MARKINKSLLSEGEMRRFMKLANISPLQEMGGSYGMAPGMRDEKEDDEKAPGARDYMQEQDEEMEMDAVEMEAPEEEAAPAEPDMEMDMEMGAEEGGEGQMIELDDFLAALETALEDVTGEEVSTDMDMAGDEEAPEEGGEPEELDMEMPPEPDMGDEEPEMAMGGEEDMEMMAERIANRVRARMMQESRKQARRKQAQKSLDERVDALTDRIFARLMKESR